VRGIAYLLLGFPNVVQMLNMLLDEGRNPQWPHAKPRAAKSCSKEELLEHYTES